MARPITFDTIATGTLEDRGGSEVWLRVALTAPECTSTPHCALQLMRNDVTIVQQAHQVTWEAVWDP